MHRAPGQTIAAVGRVRLNLEQRGDTPLLPGLLGVLPHHTYRVEKRIEPVLIRSASNLCQALFSFSHSCLVDLHRVAQASMALIGLKAAVARLVASHPTRCLH